MQTDPRRPLSPEEFAQLLRALREHAALQGEVKGAQAALSAMLKVLARKRKP